MKKDRTPELSTPGPMEIATPKLGLEKAEKGSHRPMWELLLQLRVLIPYLSHLVPLLERAPNKAPLELVELGKGIAGIQAGSRELDTLARNQAIQLERIDGQLARLHAALERNADENQKFTDEMRGFRRWMIGITIVIVVLVGATAGMVLNLMLRP